MGLEVITFRIKDQLSATWAGIVLFYSSFSDSVPVQLPDRPVDHRWRVGLEGVQAHLLWNHLLTEAQIENSPNLEGPGEKSSRFLKAKIPKTNLT